MTGHDVLVGFRLRLFTLADELGSVSAACRAMGVDRSTYYGLKARVDRWGLERPNPGLWRQVLIVRGWSCVRRRRCRRARVLG